MVGSATVVLTDPTEFTSPCQCLLETRNSVSPAHGYASLTKDDRKACWITPGLFSAEEKVHLGQKVQPKGSSGGKINGPELIWEITLENC